MAKKKNTSIVSTSKPLNPAGIGIVGTGEVPGIESLPEGKYDYITNNPNLSPSQKKRLLLAEMGLLGTRKKYSSDAEKKAAAEQRREKRLQERREALESAGINLGSGKIRHSYKGLEEDEAKRIKREVSRSRGELKRDWGQLLMLAFPKTARTIGLKPEGIRRDLKASPEYMRSLKELIYEELQEELEKGK